MIMQSAFFKLADIIPLEDAVKYLKEAVEHSYGLKGKDVVDMNNAAIDMGVNAVVKVDVPAAWADAADTEAAAKSGNDFIDNILVPMNRMEGDKLPVSAFKDHEDGTFPSGTAAYENAALPSTFRNGRWKMHPVQPVRVCMPARCYPPCSDDRRRSCERS